MCVYYDVEFVVVEISRCRGPLHRSTSASLCPAADVELYSSTALQSALQLYSSTALYTLHPLHPPSGPASPSRFAPLVTHRAHRANRARMWALSCPVMYIHTYGRSNRVEWGSRTMRNRPYPVLKCSRGSADASEGTHEKGKNFTKERNGPSNLPRTRSTFVHGTERLRRERWPSSWLTHTRRAADSPSSSQSAASTSLPSGPQRCLSFPACCKLVEADFLNLCRKITEFVPQSRRET